MVTADVKHTGETWRLLFAAPCCTARKTTSIVKTFRHSVSTQLTFNVAPNKYMEKQSVVITSTEVIVCVYGWWINDRIGGDLLNKQELILKKSCEPISDLKRKICVEPVSICQISSKYIPEEPISSQSSHLLNLEKSIVVSYRQWIEDLFRLKAKDIKAVILSTQGRLTNIQHV